MNAERSAEYIWSNKIVQHLTLHLKAHICVSMGTLWAYVKHRYWGKEQGKRRKLVFTVANRPVRFFMWQPSVLYRPACLEFVD